MYKKLCIKNDDLFRNYYNHSLLREIYYCATIYVLESIKYIDGVNIRY